MAMNEGNGNVLKYFMEQTNERLAKIENKLDDLASFKSGMLSSSRKDATIVSVVISIIGIIANVLIKVL
jgi:hypothetical protein